jgi:hypothetical protein
VKIVWLAAAASALDREYDCVRPVNPTFKAARGYAILFRAPT